MEIQCFLNFGEICPIYFRDMGYIFKIIKGVWDNGTPFQGLSISKNRSSNFRGVLYFNIYFLCIFLDDGAPPFKQSKHIYVANICHRRSKIGFPKTFPKFTLHSCADRTHPLKNHKAIGFLAILVQTPCKITKVQSQHSMLGHHRPASETPLKWRFAGGPMMSRFSMAFRWRADVGPLLGGIWIPSPSLFKITTAKKTKNLPSCQ